MSAQGYKLTRQRRAVLSVIAQAKGRMSPADIHASARSECPDLSLATVYRALEVLDRVGAVRRVHMTDHCEGFAAASLSEGHHVVCVACGRVAEFSGCNVAALVPEAVRQTGFHVEEHFLELIGTCAECFAAGSGRTGGVTESGGGGDAR